MERAFFERGIHIKPFLFQKAGGVTKYSISQKQILNTIKSDRFCFCTTMVDYYGMPSDWPGRKDADRRGAYLDKASTVENELLKDIVAQIGDSWNPAQFIQYVQMLDFEALLFSDISVLTESNPGLSDHLEHILRSFSCPEEINDDYNTCPSRRIKQHLENYVKTVDGIIVARKIGLMKMRQECPHFNKWIKKLEDTDNQ